MATNNKVQFGLSNVHFALINTDESGTITYDTPHKQPGAVNMTLEPNGSTTPFYADNMIYYQAAANQGYTGSLEMALFDEWFFLNVLKYTKDEKGVLVENANATPAPVAMLYQVEGDQKAARRTLFYVQTERGSQTAATKAESTEPQTTTVNITVTPLPDTGVIKAHTTESTDNTTYEGWFNEVYIPSGNFQNDVTLKSLSLGAASLNPEFAAGTTEYTASTTTTTNTITAVANDSNATVTIKANGVTVANNSVITWNTGTNSVVVTVSNGGAENEYTITVTKS